MLTTPNFEECVVLLQEDDDQICNNNYAIGHPLRKSAFTNTKRTSVFAYSSGLSKDFSSQMMYYNQLRKQYYCNYKISSQYTNEDSSCFPTDFSRMSNEALQRSFLSESHCNNVKCGRKLNQFCANQFIEIEEEIESKKRIGIYSYKERQQRIRKYKEKIKRFVNGINKNKDGYVKRRVLANMKPRFKGKFIKKCDSESTSED